MNKKVSLYFSIFFCFALIILSSFLLTRMYNENQAKEIRTMAVDKHVTKTVSFNSKTLSTSITLGAIGDILIHDWVYNDAKTETGYDFTPMFQHVASILHEPDLLLANQETILGGTEIGISSYPFFNSPQEVGDALVASGVDIVSTANNHSLDKGERGLIASLNYMDKIKLSHVGTYRSSNEQQTIKILTKNGIKVAYLSYTYGTNGIPIPKGKNYLVNLIDKNQMQQEIQQAKLIADVIVMSIHWGNEYERFPTATQKELAQFLAKEGVDIIFGHHPHVLQPMEWIKSENKRQCLVVYSLGNFLSGQNKDYKDIGGMATIKVTKNVDNNGTRINLTNPNFYPTFVSKRNWVKNYRIVPLQDADNYGLSNAKEKFEEIQNHMLGSL